MGPVPPSWPFHLVLMPAEPSTEKQGWESWSRGTSSHPLCVHRLMSSRSWAKPQVSAGKAERIAPIQLPECAHIGWQPRDGAGPFLPGCLPGQGWHGNVSSELLKFEVNS